LPRREEGVHGTISGAQRKSIRSAVGLNVTVAVPCRGEHGRMGNRENLGNRWRVPTREMSG